MHCRSARGPFEAIAVTLLLLITVGCWGGSGERKPLNPKQTIPVQGEIFVDGEPGWGVNVYLWDESHTDSENPTVPTGVVGEDGRVSIRTYGGNDGAPAGEYKLTFYWYEPKQGLTIGGGDPVDKFHGKYEDRANSEHTVVVEEGAETVDFGRIDLK